MFLGLLLCAISPEVALTSREQEIIDLLAQGQRDMEISETLQIAARTVRYHTENPCQKLGLANRACLIAWAARCSSVRIPHIEYD